MITVNLQKARRVQDPTGSHFEPPLEQTWPDLRKLQWLTALAYSESRFRITVTEVHPGRFCIGYGQWCCSDRPFAVAWAKVSDLAAGYAEALRVHGVKP